MPPQKTGCAIKCSYVRKIRKKTIEWENSNSKTVRKTVTSTHAQTRKAISESNTHLFSWTKEKLAAESHSLHIATEIDIWWQIASWLLDMLRKTSWRVQKKFSPLTNYWINQFFLDVSSKIIWIYEANDHFDRAYTVRRICDLTTAFNKTCDLVKQYAKRLHVHHRQCLRWSLGKTSNSTLEQWNPPQKKWMIAATMRGVAYLHWRAYGTSLSEEENTTDPLSLTNAWTFHLPPRWNIIKIRTQQDAWNY